MAEKKTTDKKPTTAERIDSIDKKLTLVLQMLGIQDLLLRKRLTEAAEAELAKGETEADRRY